MPDKVESTVTRMTEQDIVKFKERAARDPKIKDIEIDPAHAFIINAKSARVVFFDVGTNCFWSFTAPDGQYTPLACFAD